MTRFVQIETLARLMAEHAPPAWCKLVIHGAIYTERVRIHATTGRFRAYVPPYHLASAPGLPPLISNNTTVEDFLERYGLKTNEFDPSLELEIWIETWDGDPKEIALGWVMFAEPWDWVSPRILYEYFEVPSDYRGLFGYDDLHPEGEPDEALYYEASLAGLCLTVEDAETLAPMCDIEQVAFGSKSQNPTRKIGRPKRSGYESSDEPLVRIMLAERKADSTLSARSLAEKYVDEAQGHGTRASKIKRLERRLAEYGV